MHKVEALVVAVDSLSAKLDSNSAELTAVRQTCEHVMTAVTNLRIPLWTPPSHYTAAPEGSPGQHKGSDPEEQHPLRKHSSHTKPARNENVGSGTRHGLAAVKGGRLTAYFKGRKPIAAACTAVTAEEPQPQSQAAAGPREKAQHFEHPRHTPSSKRAQPVQVQSPMPSKAPRTGPEAPGPWRRKHSNVVYDSCFDDPEPVKRSALGKAAAGAMAAGAGLQKHITGAPHGVGHLGAGQGALPVGQPDRVQALHSHAQAPHEDRLSISSLRLALLPKTDKRGEEATAPTRSKQTQAAVHGSQGSQTATPDGALWTAHKQLYD